MSNLQPTALALISGGLDSLIAWRIAQRTGVDVRPVHFRTALVRPAYTDAVTASPGVEVVDLSTRHIAEVLQAEDSPGCFDCRRFLLREAKSIADSEGIELLITGDVLGQVAAGQSRADLLRLDREAGVAGRLLRPLSAPMLPPTGAQEQGRLGREVFPRIHGASRRGQLELARLLEIEGFPTPSGGSCRLGDPTFRRRLADLKAHSGTDSLNVAALGLLAIGRHFRLAWDLKAVVGRDEGENRYLSERAGQGWSCQVSDGHGAFVLLSAEPRPDALAGVAALAVRYSRARDSKQVQTVLRGADRALEIRGSSASADLLADWRI